MTHTELAEMVEEQAAELGFNLRSDLSWKENADIIRASSQPDAKEMASILDQAEKAWFAIEG